MRSLLLTLWRDDAGAILSVEWTLIGGVLVLGVTPGVVALRDATNDTMIQTANAVRALAPAPSFSGYAAAGAGGRVIASTPGVSFAPPAGANAAFRPLAGVHTPPAVYGPAATLDPAP